MTLSDDGLVVTANDLNGSSRASIEYLQRLLQPTSSFVLLDSTDLSSEDVVVECIVHCQFTGDFPDSLHSRIGVMFCGCLLFSIGWNRYIAYRW